MRVTTLHSLSVGWLLPRLGRFATRHPDIALGFETDSALSRFDDGGPDLGIRHGPGQWPGLTAHALMDERLFPVAAPTLAGIDDVRGPADLLALPLVADLARQGWPDWFRAAGVHAPRIDERYRFVDSTGAMAAAAAGLGVALARDRIVRPWLADARLRQLPGPELPARWGYHIVYPSHRRLRAPAKAFADWLLADVAEHGP